MDREEAIKLLRRDIECLSHDKCSDCILEEACDPMKTPLDSKYIEAYGMAIEALSAEPSIASASFWCRQHGYVMMRESVYEQDVAKAYFEGQNAEPCDKCEVGNPCLYCEHEFEPQQKMGRWIPVSERLPEDRDWNLAVFREKDTGYQCIPRVASYVGHDMWIVIDADSVDRGWFSDLECIAWMPLPEPYLSENPTGSESEETE